MIRITKRSQVHANEVSIVSTKIPIESARLSCGTRSSRIMTPVVTNSKELKCAKPRTERKVEVYLDSCLSESQREVEQHDPWLSGQLDAPTRCVAARLADLLSLDCAANKFGEAPLCSP